MKRLLIILGLLVGVSQAQTTTTITGTIKDLTQALVTSGKVTFTLQPSRDTTISGLARFSPAQVVCLINASGLIKAQDGTSVCTLTMNTALNPPGTYYRVDVWPFNVKTSSFTFYAVLSTYDWSTVVPTPATSPFQNFVDVISNQTIGGNKTFTGSVTFASSVVIPGSNTLSATTLSDYTVAGFSKLNSGFFATSSLVTKGALDLYNNATGIIFRNGVFNSGTLGKTGTLQAGDTSSGTATWLANNVYNLPDLSRGGSSDDSGFLYGADATQLNLAVGHCVFGGGTNATNSAGNLLDSGFGCNTNIVFPSLANAVEWQNGPNTMIVKPSALTGNRTLTLPDLSGSFGVTGNATNGFYQSKRGVSGCTTAASIGGVCASAITVSWPTAFADTNYSVNCGPSGSPTNIPGSPYVSAKGTGSATVNYFAITAAAASWATIDCEAVHD